MKYPSKLIAPAIVVIICLALFGCGSGPSTYSLGAMTPSQIVAGGGDFTLAITGANFNRSTQVSFGGTLLTPTSVQPNQLRVLVPAYTTAKAGVVDVTITGAGSLTSNTLQFTINNPVPTVMSLSEPAVMLNTASFPLEIMGTNFVTGTTVDIGGQSLVPTSVSPTRLTVAVPASSLILAAVIPIKVVNPAPGGGASSELSLTVLNPVPVLTSLSLNSTLVDSADFVLSLDGNGFAAGATVNFGSTHLTPTAVSANQLIVLVPKAAVATGAILAVTASNISPGGGTSNSLAFTVMNPVPTLTSLSLTHTLVDSAEFTLNLTGTGFVPGATVSFGSTVLTPTTVNATELSVVIPETALKTSGIVAVTASNITPGGGISNALDFTIENPAPTLTALSLSSIGAGSADFALTLTGTQFIADSKVNFGDVILTPTSFTSTQLTVTVPASAVVGGGEFPVTVTNPGPGGGVSSALVFTVINPVPTIVALSQDKVVLGSAAFPLTITGTGFVPQSTVQFGTSNLIPSSVSPTVLTVTITEAAMATAGNLTITVTNPPPGGGISNGMRFIVQNPVPVVTTTSPTSITASVSDVTLTLTGTSFVEGATTVLLTTSTATTELTPLSVQPQAVTIAIPKDMVGSAGTITISAKNKEPGGGGSNVITLTVHSKATTTWETVVNNTMVMPVSGQNYNSYNQPSVNSNGSVVFKGQGTGKSGPTFGIYVRDSFGNGNGNGNMQPISVVADNSTPVPDPNNTSYNGQLATFTQFPSFPRIDMNSDTVAFRGQSQPVWTYTLTDGTESRAGTSGVFSNPGGRTITGLGLFGNVPPTPTLDLSYFQVPGAPAGTRFDQFPGAPAIIDSSTLVFKGNYTVGVTSKTGVFFRNMVNANGTSPVQLIANSDMLIPDQPSGETVTFGSTAPPSAANGTMVFLGLDNEDSPTLGGIYAAPIASTPTLQTVVNIGAQVPGEAEGITFSRLGEGLAFDGRFVGFWAAWGGEVKTLLLTCPADGNANMLAICNQMYPNGYEAQEPVHQGIFVYDLTDKVLTPLAKNTTDFDTFVYWVFSGRPPVVPGSGTGSESGSGGTASGSSSVEVPEPPRWRSSSFIAVSGQAAGGGGAFEVTFKGKTGTVDGIYQAQGGPGQDPALNGIQTVVDTTMPGTTIDSSAPAGSILATVGMEREGLRGDWMVITSSMLDPVTSESGAGVYRTKVTPIPVPPPVVPPAPVVPGTPVVPQ